MERRQVRYTGRVQGVGFRATARAVMSPFALSGWVRNEPDGSVLLEVQGDGETIDAGLAAVRARLAGFIRAEHTCGVDAVEGERGFEIRR